MNIKLLLKPSSTCLLALTAISIVGMNFGCTTLSTLVDNNFSAKVANSTVSTSRTIDNSTRNTLPLEVDKMKHGASLPYTEYEAEHGITNGKILQANRLFGSFASESSHRSAVVLRETGHYAEFTSKNHANSIVIRFIIPDAENGGGIDATISLYVDDVYRASINLSSKYAWSYGGEEETFNEPKKGAAHHFYDESRALVGIIPAGAKLRLQKDSSDTAEFYVIDLIDLELVQAPFVMPPKHISIETCGAIANDGMDDVRAIQDCIEIAKHNKLAVWIPPGTFNSHKREIEVSEISIRGAGMWHSTIQGPLARFKFYGNNIRLSNFAILGETVDRANGAHAFHGRPGKGSVIDKLWIEHSRMGIGINSVASSPTDGLIIRNSRFRNLFADGINLSQGASNIIIENNHFRSTGDDAIASWSSQWDKIQTNTNTNNVIRNNTVQTPWRANCFAIYGGKETRLENNFCADTLNYPGIFIAHSFNAKPFLNSTIIHNNSLIRAGGKMYNKDFGALTILAKEGDIQGIAVSDLYIESPSYSGIHIGDNGNENSVTNLIFDNVIINNAGSFGIDIKNKVGGEGLFKSVVINSPRLGFVQHAANARFLLVKDNAKW